MYDTDEYAHGLSIGDCQIGYYFDPKIITLSVMLVSILMVSVFSRVSTVQVENPEKSAVDLVEERRDEPQFAALYDNYTITQGLHGFSYGHMAVDISGGKGSVIKSPISGAVSDYYVDALGNTTLIIENDTYRVTLLHGIYSVSEGETIKSGQPIGSESNQGYTTDMQGIPCKNRDCGYHSHLNVFEKTKGENVNPLTIMEP